jgi:hypothetical protein
MLILILILKPIPILIPIYTYTYTHTYTYIYLSVYLSIYLSICLPIRESLKAKADIAEVERIVKTITEAVGDLNINSADASAAIHAKCLICDKPVTAQRARTAGQKSRLNSASMPLLGYSKNMDEGPVSASVHQQNTMFNRLLSNSPAVSQNERAKVAVELAIMRSSIEPLPEITDSIESGMGGHTPHQQGAQYKTRIRHSAGGGMGPNYKMDSR